MLDGVTARRSRRRPRAAEFADYTVVVLPPDDVSGKARRCTRRCAGGDQRSDSVRAGSGRAPCDGRDGDRARCRSPARWRATSFDAVIDAVRAGADAAVPGIPVADTLKRVDGTRVVETVPRRVLVAVQTPQAFRAAALRAAHAGGGDATDDAALVEAAGGCVVVVPGDVDNLKMTTTERPRTGGRAARVTEATGACARERFGSASASTSIRSPTGVRSCSAGSSIPDSPGLAGYSDADVVAHAVSDALLGAAGLARSRHAVPGVGRRARGRVVDRLPRADRAAPRTMRAGRS